jgi:hypothetical protein
METTKISQDLLVTLVRIRDNISNKENKTHSKEKLISDLEELLTKLILELAPVPTVNKFTEDITSWDAGSGAYTGLFTKTITHGLSSDDVIAQFKDTATGEQVGVDEFIQIDINTCLVVVTSEENITITVV